ncbi:MAG: IclR family transcriptional regulator [Desulfobacterales bacterium]
MSIQSVGRALQILSLFTHEQPRLGITEISRAMHLPKPTVHGLVQTMVNFKFLTQDPETRKYCLGRKLYELGSVFTSHIKINQVGTMSAQELAARVGMAVNLAIWDDSSVLMTFRGASNYQNLQPRQFASRIPAYCSSQGKAILSSLPDDALVEYLDSTRLIAYTPNTITDRDKLTAELQHTRKQGFAVDCEEYIIGICCIGAPVLDNTGFPVGAVSISGSKEQIFGEKTHQLSSDLIKAAMEISYQMGYLPRI